MRFLKVKTQETYGSVSVFIPTEKPGPNLYTPPVESETCKHYCDEYVTVPIRAYHLLEVRGGWYAHAIVCGETIAAGIQDEIVDHLRLPPQCPTTRI